MLPVDPAPLPPAQSTDIFDRSRIRTRRSNMDRRSKEQPFFAGHLAAEIGDRLNDIKRTWTRALIIGPQSDLSATLQGQGIYVVHAGPEFALSAHAVDPVDYIACDMDRIIAAAGPYDLILWPGGIESTNDVPGALAQCRALLHPDGMFIGAFYGAGSLPALRSAVQNIDTQAHVARFHPQIDVRAMGDILQRTGFALPTIDISHLSVRYTALASLIRDMRGSALTNMLAGPVHPITRMEYAQMQANFAAQADADGRTCETLSIIHFIGWAPHPDQPKPAKRGSATASLAAALLPKDAR